MFYFRKDNEYGFTLYESLNEPANKEGLVELTQDEYTELLEEVE